MNKRTVLISLLLIANQAFGLAWHERINNWKGRFNNWMTNLQNTVPNKKLVYLNKARYDLEEKKSKLLEDELPKLKEINKIKKKVINHRRTADNSVGHFSQQHANMANIKEYELLLQLDDDGTRDDSYRQKRLHNIEHEISNKSTALQKSKDSIKRMQPTVNQLRLQRLQDVSNQFE